MGGEEEKKEKNLGKKYKYKILIDNFSDAFYNNIIIKLCKEKKMPLKYLPIHFTCHFDKCVKEETYLPFVLRSVLGYHLRKMCCITKQNQCRSCMFRHQCVYCVFFETIIDKDNTVLPGRDTVSHPFAFTRFNSDTDDNFCVSRFDLTLTLFGNAVSYLPYIYAALVRAGESGLFSGRSPFHIDEVSVGNESILLSESQIRTDISPFVFDENADRNIPNKVRIKLISPLRTQVNGKYIKDITAIDMLNAIYRRYKTMMSLYGENYHNEEKSPHWDVSFDQTDFHWRNYSRYSARQKQAMKLCGLVGTCRITGNITHDIMTLLEFGKIANIGKNTNFGFGMMEYKESE